MDLSHVFNAADQSTPGHYHPSQTALFLLDFHSLFVEQSGGPNAAAACKTAAKMREWAKSIDIPVLHGLLDLNAEPFPTCKGRQRVIDMLAMMKDQGGAEPAELMTNASDDERTFYRTPGYVNALLSPGLKEYLDDKGIKSLILCGLSTSGCVLRTAWPAADAEFVVTVLSDACADKDQEVHEMVMGKLLPSRAYVVTAEEFRTGYEGVQVGSGLASKQA